MFSSLLLDDGNVRHEYLSWRVAGGGVVQKGHAGGEKKLHNIF